MYAIGTVMPENKILIFIPTYNERENVELLCSDILAIDLDFDMLFIDDNSPDGTGRILDRLSVEQQNIHVIHRESKLGVGSAHLECIRWAYEHQYTTLVTLDCDFAHTPGYIPDFLSRTHQYDVVVGSRYLQERSLAGWSLFRKSLTLMGHVATKTILGMPYDATGAFRAYRLDKIPSKVFDLVHSTSYSFFFESMYALHRNGFQICDIPIVLPSRTYGHSKMRIVDVFASIFRLFKMAGAQIARRSQYRIK